MARNDHTDAEILAKIQAEETQAYGLHDQELAGERAQAIDYYLGKPFGNEIDGRSQVVSTDVADTVESLLPELLKVFVAGDEVVKFDPRGPEDIDQAEQETEAINHIVMEKNHGFGLFYTWFKDALLSKNGYVKVYWEEVEEVEKEFYQGLTDEEMTLLVQGDDVEVIEHTAYPDEIDLQQRQQAIQAHPEAAQDILSQPEKMLHDVRVQTKREDGRICLENVAPESMVVSTDTSTVSVQKARFVQHREMTTVAELRERGFKVDDDIADDYTDQFEQEQIARDLYNENSDRNEYDGLDRKILVKDTYMLCDGELMRYVVVGNTIIHTEEAEIIPFAAITPVIMPHRHVGRSVADLVMDIQLIKSTLMRGQLDGMYLALNGRHAITDKVNLDDFLVSRPNGVVRVSGIPAENIMPLVTPDVSAIAYPMMEYLDSVKENRTGVTKYNQGLDANSLNKTASGISQIMGASQKRTELIARIFAEGGVKELFMLVHRLMRMHSQRELVLRLRNKWVAVDPRQWKTRTDLSVSVGLGTGNKDQMLGHLMTILQAQKEGIEIGLATPKNIYNALAKLTQNAGFKNPEEFWTDPEGAEQKPEAPPQPSPDTVLLAQTEIQKTQIKAESDEKIATQKAAIEYQKAIDLAQIDQQTEAAKAHQADVSNQRDYIIDSVKMVIDSRLQQHAQSQAPLEDQEAPEVEEQPDKMHEAMLQAIGMMTQAIQHMNQPKQIIRDPNGRAVGVAPVRGS